METGKYLRALEGHTDQVAAVAVIDQRRVVSASHDRTLRVWDVEAARTVDRKILVLARPEAGKAYLLVAHAAGLAERISGQAGRSMDSRLSRHCRDN